MNRVEVSLSRDLSFFDITMIGVAGMIGAGIFALTGIASGIAGPAILLAFFLNGIIATFIGMSYAELGSAIPQAGGGYVWIKEAINNFAGFMFGWIDWAAHTIACALYAVTFGAFFSEFVVRFLGFNFPQDLVSKISSLAVVSLLAFINYRGVKESGKLGGIVTMLKVLILIVFASFGIYKTFTSPHWISSYKPFMPTGAVGILAAMGLTFIAFEGFEIIVQSGEEVKKPEKNIPRAIIVSLWIAVSIYILVAFSLLGSVKTNVPSWVYLGKLGEFSLIRVANQIMPFGAIVIIAGGLISTLSAMNATIYSSSRVVFALSRSGYLSEIFSKINEKTKTPHMAILFSYIIIASASLAPIKAVASAADIMFIILFTLVSISVIILRLRRPDLRRTFRVPLAQITIPLATLSMLIISYFLITVIKQGLVVLEATILWIILGVMIYYTYSEKKLEKKLEEEFVTVYSEAPVEKKQFRILVPVANPVIAMKLLSFAEKIAKQRDGEIIVMNTVRIPYPTPISAEVADINVAKSMVSELISTASVPCGGVVKVSHSVAEAIINVVDEYKADLLIMGWRGRTFRRDAVLGSTIDPVLLKARCDAIVVRFQAGKAVPRFKRILIPTAGGPHAMLAYEIAKDIAEVEKAKIRLIYVGKSEKDFETAQKAFNEALKIIEAETKFAIGNPVEMISKEAENHDLVLIGATSKPFLQNFLLGLFPEKIVNRTTKTVAMTRKWVKFF